MAAQHKPAPLTLPFQRRNNAGAASVAREPLAFREKKAARRAEKKIFSERARLLRKQRQRERVSTLCEGNLQVSFDKFCSDEQKRLMLFSHRHPEDITSLSMNATFRTQAESIRNGEHGTGTVALPLRLKRRFVCANSFKIATFS